MLQRCDREVTIVLNGPAGLSYEKGRSEGRPAIKFSL